MFWAGLLGSSVAEAQEGQAVPLPRVGWSATQHLDLDLDGGFAWDLTRSQPVGFGRVRVGVLSLRAPLDDPMASPLLISLGATYGLSSISLAELGLEAEIAHVKTGFWFQTGAAVDVLHLGPVWRLGAGWSFIGVEAQRRLLVRDDPSQTTGGFVLGAKLRLPLGGLLMALTR